MYPDSDKNLTYETDNAVYFFSGPFDPLNNWSAHAVTIWNQTFPTLEHAFHWRKFYETAPDVAKQIKSAPSPWAAMRLERAHRTSRRNDWQTVKVAVMIELVRAKAAQNIDVRDALIKTGSKQIIENSPDNAFWGIGPNGDGQNHMGKILMQVRDELN